MTDRTKAQAWLAKLAEDEMASLHFASGLLLGLCHKYGEADVLIYHDGVRIRLDVVTPEEKRRDMS